YYDYYQPEAYIPATDTYIEKDLSINAELERLRIRATSALLSGRSDVIVVASVSCIYGIGRPDEYVSHIVTFEKGQRISRRQFLRKLSEMLYARVENDFSPGQFRVRGENVEVFPPHEEQPVRITFFDDEIESIVRIDAVSGRKLAELRDVTLFPTSLFVISQDVLQAGIRGIQDELVRQIEYFEKRGMSVEAKRIKERTEYDIEMMREVGFCKGIENYSLHLTGRKPESRPYCLLDYLPPRTVIVVDESHATIPQIRAMWGGDRSRKMILVENGFRLPSALDNRPLKFEEFESMCGQTIFVSATPGDYELELTGGVVVEQIVRPTGLLDPPVEVRPLHNQVDDLLEEIRQVVAGGGRVLVTTLTKRMSEELSRYLVELGIRARYLHSEIETLDRVDVLKGLREGEFDVLVGVNLLREGLDLPEVELVAILDADKEGFLRSARTFIQIAGRAARNARGRVVLYAERITDSMRTLMRETERRRAKQVEYNQKHGITPRTIRKAVTDPIREILHGVPVEESAPAPEKRAAEYAFASAEEIRQAIDELKKKMKKHAENLDFIQAAKCRDEIFALEALFKQEKKAVRGRERRTES
ncbi:MAG: excinuclease ABC subunit UvrB, partial [Bacteroidia bacterium]|nr:excinuclease ABC subunit UvrB [Bacteroidia bacterium]